MIEAEIDILRELGVEFRCGVEVGRDVTLAELRAQGYKAFYVAIGCQGGRTAGYSRRGCRGIQTVAVALLRGTVGGIESAKCPAKPSWWAAATLLLMSPASPCAAGPAM